MSKTYNDIKSELNITPETTLDELIDIAEAQGVVSQGELTKIRSVSVLPLANTVKDKAQELKNRMTNTVIDEDKGAVSIINKRNVILIEIINKLLDLVNTKQATLVNETNIKSINGVNILGSGNIDTHNVGVIELDFSEAVDNEIEITDDQLALMQKEYAVIKIENDYYNKKTINEENNLIYFLYENYFQTILNSGIRESVSQFIVVNTSEMTATYVSQNGFSFYEKSKEDALLALKQNVIPTSSATIASESEGIVTIKAGVSQNDGAIGNSSSSDITLGASAKKGVATSISSSSTNNDLSTAKAVYDFIDAYNTIVTGLINNVLEVAEGKTKNYVIDDSETGTNVVNTSFASVNDIIILSIGSNKIQPLAEEEELLLSDLKVGDIISILQTDVPDRWVAYIDTETDQIMFSKLETKFDIDTIPTQNSTNPITSEAVYSGLAGKVDKSQIGYVELGISGTSGTLTNDEFAEVQKPYCIIKRGNQVYHKHQVTSTGITFRQIPIVSGGGDYKQITNYYISIVLSTQGWSSGDFSYNFYTKDVDDTLLSAKENLSNKVTSISSSSTDNEYPSAKCVYDIVGDIETLLASI